MVIKFNAKNLNIWFGQIHALKGVNLEVEANEILSVIGPSNSGKTSFLRMLNRLNDLHTGFKMSGWLEYDKMDIRKLDIEVLRKKVGMVLFVLASLVGLARIFSGVHHLTDIIASFVVAGLVTFFAYRIVFPMFLNSKLYQKFQK